MINLEDFLNDLKESVNDAQMEELGIELSQDIDNDRNAIQSQNQANFFIKLVKDLENDINVVNELVDQEIKSTIDNMNAFRDSRLATLNNQKRYFEAMLKDFTIRELDGKKTKSVKLPYGTLSLKKPASKYTYDDKVVKEWLLKNKPEFTRRKESIDIDKTLLKKEGVVSSDGTLIIGEQTVPGVKIEEQEIEFKVK